MRMLALAVPVPATRCALITGRYQYRLPLGLEEPLAGNPDIGLPPEHPTLPSLLKQVGYQTSLVGKWHLGYPPKFGPVRSGYDRFFGIRSGTADYYTHENTRQEHDLWDGDDPDKRTGYLTDILGDRAVNTVNEYAASKQPFLLSLHFNAPHWPWVAPGDNAESERLRGSNLRHFDGGTQRTYYRMIEAMDLQIGRLLQALEANGQSDNTIVIFTSDNGGERFSDTWPFTGIKTDLLEGGIRIPAVICWPARIPAGQVSDQVMITMDWFATLLSAAGTTPHSDYPPDGMDLLPVLTDPGKPIRRTLFWRYKTKAQRAVRDGEFKYLKIEDNEFLFDVVADPRERGNLKPRRKDLFDRMVADWHAWNATMLPENPNSGERDLHRFTTWPIRFGSR